MFLFFEQIPPALWVMREKVEGTKEKQEWFLTGFMTTPVVV